jgi:hypothetical protein
MTRFNNLNEITESTALPEIRNSMITYEDMYNILYRQMITLTRKDKDNFLSVKLWCAQLEESGHFIFLESPEYNNSLDHKVFAIMSPEQREVRAYSIV